MEAEAGYLEGKQEKISEIVELIEKVALIPGNVLAYRDAGAICSYLVELGAALGNQIREASANSKDLTR